MPTVAYRQLVNFPGYRIGSDGTVWSEWKFKGQGRGMPPIWYRSGEWRPMHPDGSRNRVKLRVNEGRYVSRSIESLVQEAFGPITNPANPQ